MTSVPRIVAVNGSIQRGTTAYVLERVGNLARQRGVEFDVIELRRIRMVQCGSCADCYRRLMPCEQPDDVLAAVQRLAAADGIILAAPVQGYGPAGLMQTFIERSGVGYLRFDRPLSNKVGGVIVVARRYSAEQVWAQLAANVLLNRMIMVGSGFPAQVRALHPEEAAQDEEGLANVDRMVERLIDMIELLSEYRRLTGKTEILPIDERNERAGIPLDQLALLR